MMVLVIAVLLVSGSRVVYAEPYRTLDVSDPSGLDSQINSLGFELTNEIGNYTVSQFNIHPHGLVLTIDTTDGYPPQYMPSGNGLDRIGTVYLTEAGGSGVDLDIFFEHPRLVFDDSFPDETIAGQGFTRILHADTEDWRTSGDQDLVYRMIYLPSTAKIIFDKDVYGVGFTVNRLEADMTVRLFDSTDAQIGSDYTVPSNTLTGYPDYQTNHSFFGYYNHGTAEIRKIEIDMNTATNQFSIDDVVVVADVTGLGDCYGIAMEGDLNEDCYVDLIDFSMLASDWLQITPVE